MPWGLERWHGGHDLHFITFSCYARQPLLTSAHRRDLFLTALEQVRQRYGWAILGYVVMPNHVHLLVSEPPARPLSTAVQALKLGLRVVYWRKNAGFAVVRRWLCSNLGCDEFGRLGITT